MSTPKIDEIDYWSEIKLDIVREYAQAYSTIMAKQSAIKNYLYIDGFAGAGVHISKQTGQYVPGSPLNALNVTPPFPEYHFIDMDGGRADALRQLGGDRPDVKVYEGDCNSVLLERVFPRARFEDYSRALCLLDPYNVNPRWEVTSTAGRMKSIEIFLNFMVMDMNMNVLWRDPDRVDPQQIERMNAFWGNNSWRDVAYVETPTLFEPVPEKVSNEAIARAFQKRLREVAGFKYVPEPMPMRNSKGAVIYYLFFASPNETGSRIVTGHLQEVPRQGDEVMAVQSSIEWTDSTWNPVTGCSKVSPGCMHCYAERLAKRLHAMGMRNYAKGFQVALHPAALALPQAWKKPQMVFVNSMSDLFHKDVPEGFIVRVFQIMEKANWHQYQILTKRSERLVELAPRLPWESHIWMGVSVEDERFTFRIDHLRKTDARIKFVSFEPLLGPVPKLVLNGIDWVIVGGESGPGARPLDRAWVVDIREQCRAARVPFFFKQWGGTHRKEKGRTLDGRTWDEVPVPAT